MILAMIVWLRHLLGCLVSAFRSRQDLILENLALRQQLLALHVQRPRRRLTAPQKLFWVLGTRISRLVCDIQRRSDQFCDGPASKGRIRLSETTEPVVLTNHKE